jgi:PAS domain S-box-containing protein
MKYFFTIIIIQYDFQPLAITPSSVNMNANNVIPRNNFTFSGTFIVWLKQLSIAAVYVLIGYMIQHNFVSQGMVSAVWPGSGLVLAVLLIGGRRYLWGILLGALLVNATTNGTVIWIIGATLASLLEALLGLWLLTRNDSYPFSLNTLSDYLSLIVLGGGVACVIGAIIGASALLLLGFITPDDYFGNVLHWWMGDTLGVVLVTPLILTWWKGKREPPNVKQLLEGLFLMGITFFIGQLVFLGWFDESFIVAPKAFVMFLLITWIAIRLGSRATTFALNMIAMQALLSAYLRVGYFTNELAEAALYNYWFYMLILSGVGMALAAYVNETKQMEEALRESEALLRESQAIAGLGSYVLDIPAGLWKSSTVLDELFGIDEAYERSVEGWLALVRSDDRAMMADYFRNEVLAQGKAFDKEYRIIRLGDQAERWVHGLGQLEFDAQGRPLKMHGTIQDITGRKKTEIELRIAAIAFESQEGMSVADADNVILRVNHAFTNITGYTAEEVIGKSPCLFHSDRHNAEFYSAMWDSIQRMGTWEGEVWNQRKNGEVYPAHLYHHRGKRRGRHRHQLCCHIHRHHRQQSGCGRNRAPGIL